LEEERKIVADGVYGFLDRDGTDLDYIGMR
jgi:hypothetical protein